KGELISFSFEHEPHETRPRKHPTQTRRGKRRSLVYCRGVADKLCAVRQVDPERPAFIHSCHYFIHMAVLPFLCYISPSASFTSLSSLSTLSAACALVAPLAKAYILSFSSVPDGRMMI